MAKRDNGTGTIYQRTNGNWVGKIYLGRGSDGKEKFKYLSGKTEGEVKRKIREFNQSKAPVDTKRVALQDYLYDWLKKFKMGTIKESSYDALEKTIRNQIVPYIGEIQLQQVSAGDIQSLLNNLKERGYSYSTVKKAHDCLSGMFDHATIADDVQKNPMRLVKMLAASEFPKKEIRYFTKAECALIIEEAGRLYTTGKPVYQYADVYILMLHTGLRMGEAIGLKKSDWDKNSDTLHIQRNVQSISKRDSSGNRVRGKRLITNTTKTYSGNRLLPLNKAAVDALTRLCAQHPDSEYIVCSSKGDPVPPERLERTFYRILDNVHIEQAGTHSLRHTFASMLFSKGTDVKTVSELLGHASIQITLNTYVHLIGDAKHGAVSKLDNLF